MAVLVTTSPDWKDFWQCLSTSQISQISVYSRTRAGNVVVTGRRNNERRNQAWMKLHKDMDGPNLQT